jgi:hypothetical protein
MSTTPIVTGHAKMAFFLDRMWFSCCGADPV